MRDMPPPQRGVEWKCAHQTHRPSLGFDPHQTVASHRQPTSRQTTKQPRESVARPNISARIRALKICRPSTRSYPGPHEVICVPPTMEPTPPSTRAACDKLTRGESVTQSYPQASSRS